MSDLAPLVKSVMVPLAPSEAYRLFTDRIAEWWPLAGHSVSEERARTCVFNARVGGRIYEVRDDGVESEWGRVTAADPPHRVAFTWHPGRDPETAQSVEVHFVAEGDGTRVTLEHRGWQRLGERAARDRAGYDTGWGFVLGDRYRRAAG
jgi:uncharacterized protein YndB with AHSA1/START domain